MHLKPIRMFIIIGGMLSLFVVSSILAAGLVADQKGVTLNASVESVDKTTKTITLSVDTKHDITSFIQYGDDVEIVVDEKFESTSNQMDTSDQKGSWRMQRQRPIIQGGQ